MVYYWARIVHGINVLSGDIPQGIRILNPPWINIIALVDQFIPSLIYFKNTELSI
jgi:hypothetical protein